MQLLCQLLQDIYQWNGSKSNRFERLKACQLVNSIKNEEKGGKGVVHLIDEGSEIPDKMMKVSVNYLINSYGWESLY